MSSRFTCRRPSRVRAFTIVELMVVVTIVGLLVTLILPSVTAARESARRVICLSNERQYGVALPNFEADYRVLPNTNTDSSQRLISLYCARLWTILRLRTVRQLPLTTVNLSSSQFLRDYVKIDISPMSLPQFSNILSWQKLGLQNCPSATQTIYANVAPQDGDIYNPNSDFQKWGAMRLFYVTSGTNVCWWKNGELLNGARERLISKRNMDRVVYPTITIGIYENNMPGVVNNHLGVGMNIVSMDGSGRWVKSTDCYSDPTLRFSAQYYGDVAGSSCYMPKNYAAVSAGFPNMNVFFPAGFGPPSFLGTNTTATNMDQYLRYMGFYTDEW